MFAIVYDRPTTYCTIRAFFFSEKNKTFFNGTVKKIYVFHHLNVFFYIMFRKNYLLYGMPPFTYENTTIYDQKNVSFIAYFTYKRY
jgi:hypothetical protein